MTTKLTLRAALATASVFFAAASWAALPAKLGDKELPSLAPLVQEVSPAVVNIATQGTRDAPNNPLMDDPFFRRFFGFPEQQRQRPVRSAGSGVIVDAQKGYIITNHHVVENADKIEVTLVDDRSFSAEVIGSQFGDKLVVQKLRRRKNSRRKTGHRQVYTRVRINKISC